MLDRIRGLEPAARAAQTREDEAARELAQFRRRLQEQQQRLQQLLEFRREYTEQLEAVGKSGVMARQLRGFSDFVANLDRNIAQLQAHLQALHGEFQRKHNQWLRSHARTQALESVIEGYRREQDKAADRREQADQDERGPRGPRGISGH